MSEDLIIGIDLGTTHSLVGVVDAGFPLILADRDGDRLTPSVVAYPIEGDPLVGREAQRFSQTAPERTVQSVKRLLGRPFSRLAPSDFDEFSQPLERLSTGEVSIRISSDRGITPVDVSSQILARLKQIADEALETNTKRAVITVPAYFNNAQREATKQAGERAGLKVERILNEPTAAALAYGLEKLEDEQTVAVYDLGGGTFDLSILQMKEGLFEVVSTAGDTQLGGDDIDRAIARSVQNRLGIPSLNDSQQATLLAASREAKEALSTSNSHTIRLPFFHENQSFESTLTRDDCEQIMTPLIDRTRSICQRALAEAAAKGTAQIDHFILVGGSTRIPLVRERIEQWFSIEPNLSQHPDEAVALGAAIQAGILSGQVRNVILVDVTPLSLGIETFGGLMNVIIPRNS
ncbi:MAG: Hsp70 family protein, partial [Verrucomicrobiota bacterium]